MGDAQIVIALHGDVCFQQPVTPEQVSAYPELTPQQCWLFNNKLVYMSQGSHGHIERLFPTHTVVAEPPPRIRMTAPVERVRSVASLVQQTQPLQPVANPVPTPTPIPPTHTRIRS